MIKIKLIVSCRDIFSPVSYHIFLYFHQIGTDLKNYTTDLKNAASTFGLCFCKSSIYLSLFYGRKYNTNTFIIYVVSNFIYVIVKSANIDNYQHI